MASSMRLIASNFFTKSFRSTLVASSRFHGIIAGDRSYCSTPNDHVSDVCAKSWLRIECPKVSSLSFKMAMDDTRRSIELAIKEDGLRIVLDDMPGLTELRKKDTRACAEPNNLFILGKTIDLPNKITDTDHIKEDGMLEVASPTDDSIITNIIANEIIATFRDITKERSWAYYDMFYDRSILGRGLCPIIAKLSSINSFTLYKKETAYSLEIKMCMPGHQKMKLTPQGLKVTLEEMDGLKRENVKVFFDYDTFFIEGKTWKEHYITGIRLPEGVSKKHNMIKRQMKYDTFSATLPCRVKKEALHEITDKLKPRSCLPYSFC